MNHRKFTLTFVLGVLVLASGAPASATEDATSKGATFYRDVLPIIQEKCQTCHREGGDNIAGMVAPMSFTTYKEVRPWAKAIARQVQAREMPPWDASDVTAGVFVNERTLTDEEIATFVQWSRSGAPAGRVEDAPEKKVFENNDGWVIGEPDLIVYMPEPYFVADDVEDVQPRILIPVTEEMLPEPRWIQAIEYKPGSEVVHHITGRASTSEDLEGENVETFSLGSIAAGEDPTIYPEGFGNLLRPGLLIRLSLHYHKEAGPGTGVWDRSAVGFKFHPPGAEVKHKVTWNTIGNGAFEIPPLHPNWEVGAARVFEKDTILLSLHPHMHYRGKDMTYTAFYPDGTEEVLLDVPNYDYAWQTNYIYREPKLIPAGTLIEVVAHYDNSEAKAEEYPNINVNRAVRFGAPSTDEMMNPFVAWTYIEPEEAEKFRVSQSGGVADK